MSNIGRPEDWQPRVPQKKSALNPNPYGRPYRTVETRRHIETIQLEDGRVATRTDETVTESDGVERDPPREIKYPEREPGGARGCLTALVVFLGMCFAYDSLSTVSDHPLAIFGYWAVAFVIWAAIQ